MGTLEQLYKEAHMAYSQQAQDQTIMEVGPPALVKPSALYIPSQCLADNLMRDLDPETSS